MEVSYDSKCLDLAKAFIEDHPLIPSESADELAQHIQNEIEDWIEDAETP